LDEIYNWLKKLNFYDFSNKSVLIIGGGEMAKQYALASKKLKVNDITIITKTGKNISQFSIDNKLNLLTGGYEKHLSSIEKKDLIIIATPISSLISATKLAIESGQDNILMEKPGSLFAHKLLELANLTSSQEVRVAYNRFVYPNVHKLKQLINEDEGITSCRFTFTERLSKINFQKENSDVYHMWGISNSLHVISLSFYLIGIPKEIYPHQYGKLEWHPTGSIFVGSGLSVNNIPFSYHADWGSGGRWGIEVNTKKNSYQLIPLEELYFCPREGENWAKVSFEKSFPQIKQGIAEEVAIMLHGDKEYKAHLPSLEEASRFNKIAEKIFSYNIT